MSGMERREHGDPRAPGGWTFATAPRLRLPMRWNSTAPAWSRNEILMNQPVALTRAAAPLGKALRSNRWNAQRREVDHPFAFRVDGQQRGGLSRQTLMAGSAGHLAALLLLLLALVVLASGCAAQSNPGAASAADAQATMHRVHVVRHGWHSGIVVRAADVPEQARPARRDFVGAEHLEVGFGDRAYYQATDPSVWLGLRALLWPTAGVPVSPALSQTSGALFAQLRRHGQVIRPTP